MNIISAIYKLYPQVIRTVGDEAFDEQGNEVAYDLSAVTEQAKKDECKAKAKALLSATDWAVLPDVGLKNSAEYVTYRGILRGLVTQPQVDPTFPVEPDPVWE